MSATNLERNLKVCKDFNETKNRAAVGRIYNISRVRVLQICEREKDWLEMAKKPSKKGISVPVQN